MIVAVMARVGSSVMCWGKNRQGRDPGELLGGVVSVVV